MNPSLELLENVLFSIVWNHNPLGSGKVVNSDVTFLRFGWEEAGERGDFCQADLDLPIEHQFCVKG